MAKYIVPPRECVAEAVSAFEKALNATKFPDGDFVYKQSFDLKDKHARVLFTPTAYAKMLTLIREFDKEVAWHGLARRGDDPEKNEYIVYDIKVYPQVVTGATVNTDQAEYEKWLMDFEDEDFNNIRMQGHSHVSMSTSPSGVDLTHQQRIIEQLTGDMFYIFMIWNKRLENTTKIYDMRKNIFFEPKDISVELLDENNSLSEFLRQAKDTVKDKPAVTYVAGAAPSYQPGSAGKETFAEKTMEEKKKNRLHVTVTPVNASDYDDTNDPYGPFGYNENYVDYNYWR